MPGFSAWTLKLKGPQAPKGTPEIRSGLQTANDEQEQPIRCRQCGLEITSRDQAVTIQGRHQHTFFNPAGIVFEIVCFGAAPGCQNEGTPTKDFSWFPDYSWCYSFCSACRSMLGWQFQSGTGSVFWGLILNRLE